ncbi:MAG: methyltransferase domain-containing protein [Proteobacteria bacterium]|nr:methyltransferase domain-containing protein [Pseudomonadota bacterium]
MEFSTKYHDQSFPEQYATKHRETVFRRLNDHREKRLLAKSLAKIQPPDSLIDVGCGPGRFWPVLCKTPATTLCGLDVSHSMLAFARDHQPDGGHFLTTSGSVTQLPFADAAFDCVVAMRLLHHFGEVEERAQAISELRRIARRNVIVSLWVDGNYKAWRRQALEKRRSARSYQNRHVFKREVLHQEFTEAGLNVRHHLDLLPGYSQWRYYVLECV